MRTKDPIPADDLAHWRAQGLDVLVAGFDGPDPRDVAGREHGIGFCGPGRVPLAADLLLLEPLLLPRTLILFDGRIANARFVARNLQRDWEMPRDREADVTFLELMEEPLGRHDDRRLAQLSASTRNGRRRTA
jgi:hypothetical protein